MKPTVANLGCKLVLDTDSPGVPMNIIKYHRSGNFHVKYISPFNFSRCFIFVARTHRQKLNQAKISFTRTRTRARSWDRIPCCAIGEELERQISASEGMQQTPMPYH